MAIQVYCNGCDTYHNENNVQASDISSDDMGRDILTFKCPSCGKDTDSLRMGRA